MPVEWLDFESGETAAVNDAFDRLNRNSRKLEAQELRHARFDGWFISTVENECQESSWRTFGIVTKAREKRMKDAQFISELLLVLIEKKQFGFDQQQLDETYAKYDDPDDEGIELDTEVFASALGDAKEFLTAMNTINNCVREAGATVGAFYTLWSLVALHRTNLRPAEELAVHYKNFVNLAAQMRDQTDPAQLQLDTGQEALRASAFRYDKALQGAHTDLAPRNARLESLLQAMQLQCRSRYQFVANITRFTRITSSSRSLSIARLRIRNRAVGITKVV